MLWHNFDLFLKERINSTHKVLKNDANQTFETDVLGRRSLLIILCFEGNNYVKNRARNLFSLRTRDGF